ncbi:hypothetical protein PybrP1_005671, partial [[Pythium] brassicae (nom. inval.)]
MSQQHTKYGTSSLKNDDEFRFATTDCCRRRVVKWAAAAVAVSVGGALIAVSTSGLSSPGGATSPAAEKHGAVNCWQSSYIGGEKKMMEPITSGLEWKKKTDGAKATSFIAVDVSKKFQEILGFGGAFTEASGVQFSKLPPAKQEEMLKLYFDKEKGSGYEFGRVPMGSSDFSLGSYSFDDVPNDMSLSHFDTNVTRDTQYIIPFIQRALEKNPQLKIMLAPWSPPGWMKRASETYIPSIMGTAKPIGLKDEAQPAWALYFSKFISAYKSHGINFWGLSPQNEPESAVPWESCEYTAPFEAEFIANHLGPVIKRDHPDVKIMVFDQNRDSLLHWTETILSHPGASKYVDGVSFHWYGALQHLDGVEFYDRLNDTHYMVGNRFLLAAESCNCPGNGSAAVAHGDEAWVRGQRYGRDILMDINNWAVGWVDWNLILDHTGGPNHMQNLCDAPIVVDETEKDYFIQPMYYFIQHFSKFVQSGSRRIHTDVSATFKKAGDAQLFVRYPAALHSCDSSARQAIHVTEDSKLQVTGTPFCLILVNDAGRAKWVGPQIELVECQYTTQTWTFKDGQIRLKDQCLALK